MEFDLAYPVTLTPDDEAGGFVVTFADFPEAITQGDDEAGALAEAADALEEAVAGRIRRGEAIPPASPAAPGRHRVPIPPAMAARAALHLAMTEAGVDGAQLAARLGCEEREVRRLLDPRAALNLPLIERALAGLGRRLALRLMEGQAA